MVATCFVVEYGIIFPVVDLYLVVMWFQIQFNKLGSWYSSSFRFLVIVLNIGSNVYVVLTLSEKQCLHGSGRDHEQGIGNPLHKSITAHGNKCRLHMRRMSSGMEAALWDE